MSKETISHYKASLPLHFSRHICGYTTTLLLLAEKQRAKARESPSSTHCESGFKRSVAFTGEFRGNLWNARGEMRVICIAGNLGVDFQPLQLSYILRLYVTRVYAHVTRLHPSHPSDDNAWGNMTRMIYGYSPSKASRYASKIPWRGSTCEIAYELFESSSFPSSCFFCILFLSGKER